MTAISGISCLARLPLRDEGECGCTQGMMSSSSSSQGIQPTPTGGQECRGFYLTAMTAATDSQESVREETVTKNLNVVVLPNEEVSLSTAANSILTLPSRTKRKHVMVFNISKMKDKINMLGLRTFGGMTQTATSSQLPTAQEQSDYYKEFTMSHSRTDTSFQETTKTVTHRLTPTIALIRNNFYTIRATKIIIRAPPRPVMIQKGFQVPPRVIIRPASTVTMTRIITVCPRMFHYRGFAAQSIPFEWSHPHKQQLEQPEIPMPPVQLPTPSKCHPRDPNDVLPKPNNNVN